MAYSSVLLTMQINTLAVVIVVIIPCSPGASKQQIIIQGPGREQGAISSIHTNTGNEGLIAGANGIDVQARCASNRSMEVLSGEGKELENVYRINALVNIETLIE